MLPNLICGGGRRNRGGGGGEGSGGGGEQGRELEERRERGCDWFRGKSDTILEK